MKRWNRRLAIWLCLCLVIGLLPPVVVRTRAASAITIKLVIANKKMTKKTYSLELGKKRQLSVKLNHTFGKTTIKYTSGKKSVATISKKGFIRSQSVGTTKIKVKVTCKSGRKKATKSSWVKIKVVDSDATPEPGPDVTPDPGSVTPTAPVGGSLQAVLLVNGNNAKQFPMTILDNTSGRMLYDSLPKVLRLEDQNKNTKVGLDGELIYTMDEYRPTQLMAGDFMLYGTSRYELTYEAHQSGYSYTRLGWIADPSGLKEALGSGAVSVTIIRSTLPTVPPTATPAPTQTPRPSGWTPTPHPSGWTPGPSTSPTPHPSGWTPGPSTSPTPLPSGVTPAPSTPTPSSSVKPSGSPTPTPIPIYTGPRIKIAANGYDYKVAVNQSSKAAMAFYNSLSTTEPLQMFMIPYNPVDRYYVTLSKTYTKEDERVEPRWPAGSLVMFNDNLLCVFRLTTQNTSNINATILGTIDMSDLPSDNQSVSFLKTMFNGDEMVTVEFYKV
ncbi:MAG: cyclophilin-like fold protein [Eubacterium sp.]|nr:cyclophilin-like fold protein [Eubacterium sp.]